MFDSRPILTSALALLLACHARGEVVVEQNFDGFPLNGEGRFGVTARPGTTDVGGRWGTFGTNGIAPRNQENVSEGGSAVELFRGEGDGSQVLIGSLAPLLPAQEIEFEFSLLIPKEGGASVMLARGHDIIIGFMANQRETLTFRAWDGVIGKWVLQPGNFAGGEWIRVKIKGSADSGTYAVRVYDPSQAEIFSADIPFDKARILEGGIDNLVVAPQFAGPIYFDNTIVRIKP